HAPPRTGSRSMRATRLPKNAACAAPFSPAGPEPMTIRSNMTSVLNQRMDVYVAELFAAVEEAELDQERRADERRAELIDQRARGRSRAAGCEHVVDEQHAIGGDDRVVVNLERVA